MSDGPGASVRSYRVRAPAPEIRDSVSGIHGYAENGDRLQGYVEPASLTAPLIFNFGSPHRIALGRAPGSRDRWASFAAGLHAGPVVMDSDGAASCVQINFTPLGARRFFRRPMSELADRMAALDDLQDRQLLELATRLAEAASWGARLAMAEAFVVARLRSADPPDPEIAWAFDALRRRNGDLRVGRLASELGWSRARLLRRFTRECGLSPKAVSRVLRFNSALAMASAPTSRWADVAAACGYADQSHLTREFAVLAGRSPAAWLRGA